MNRKTLSKIRREAGAKGLDTRWGGRNERATASMRLYPADAAEIKKRAKASGRLPADVVAEMVRA